MPYFFLLLLVITLNFDFASKAWSSVNCIRTAISAPTRETTIIDGEFLSHVLPSGPQGRWLIRYRVTIPKSFDPNKKYGVVYFLHGRTGDRFVLDNLGIKQRFDDYINEGNNPFILVTVNGENGYWMNAARKNERWSDMLFNELIPTIEEKFPVFNFKNGRILAGISMGGHGAIQNALNHPGVFGAIAAHSPVFRTQEEALNDFPDQFGSGDDYQNRDPFSLIQFKHKNIDVPLWIDIGRQDFAFDNTNNFANLIRRQQYQADLHIGEDSIGSHVTAYWAYHLYEYLRWYGIHLPAPTN